MSLLKSEPFAAVESMDQLLAIAYAMEQEAIAGTLRRALAIAARTAAK